MAYNAGTEYFLIPVDKELHLEPEPRGRPDSSAAEETL